jgi:type IV pilus assembly protein PilC
MVFCIAIVAVVVMLLFIVPVFQKMFAGLGGKLPLPTLMLVYLSHAMRFIVPIGVVLLVVFLRWWGKHKHDEAVRQKLDPWRLKLPIFGMLIKKIAIARFARNFGTMIGAGVPLLQALDIVGEVSGNWVIEQAVKDVQDSVRRGESLSGPLARHEVFPSMVVQMMAVGEDAGSLEIMLEKISEFYDQEVEATTEQLTSLIEPLMIAFIGVVVGGMIVALYLPIFNIFKLIG